jgi:hypothetical protein
MEQALDKKTSLNQKDLYGYMKARWLEWEACR